MRLKDLRILLLVLAGFGFSLTALGWTAQIHVEICAQDHEEHSQECDHEEHDHDEHKRNSCVICQHLATLSKQVLYESSIVSIHVPAVHLGQDTVPTVQYSQNTLTWGSPRAPPRTL
ncbi:DUF2946 family protein [Planctomycetota bacterium]